MEFLKAQNGDKKLDNWNTNDFKYNPSKFLTRDKATYDCPHSNIPDPISISAISKVTPCDLWIVIAQDNINGIWHIPISGIVSLFHVWYSIILFSPLLNCTNGYSFFNSNSMLDREALFHF